MHSKTVDREALLDVLGKTLAVLEEPSHEIRARLAGLGAGVEDAAGSEAAMMAGVLEDSVEYLRRDTHLVTGPMGAEALARIPSFQNEPYIPSHRALSLLQSALDEYLETHVGVEEVFDPSDPGWVEVAWEKLKALFRGKHPFIRHQQLTDFVEAVGDDLRIALVADWGTGTEHAERVMQQIAAANPTHVIHLGDVYYSGTEREVRTRFLDVIDRFGPAGRVYRALNSNHEMYSGGYAYFDVTLPRFNQAASYFNLRSDRWQIIGLDSGHEDHGLRDPQTEWLRAQVDTAGGRRTILLTHHQLFSAYDDRPKGKKLGKKVAPLLPGIFSWFWGHEHRCIVYGRHLGIHGRCIGHGAIPFTVPFGVPQEVPVLAADERPATPGGSTGIHGFALLSLAGDIATVQFIDEAGIVFHAEQLA